MLPPTAPHTGFGCNLCRMLHQMKQGTQMVSRCRLKRLRFAKESKTLVESKNVVAHRLSLDASRVAGAAQGWSLDLPHVEGSGRGVQCVSVQILVRRLIYLVTAGCIHRVPCPRASMCTHGFLPSSPEQAPSAVQARRTQCRQRPEQEYNYTVFVLQLSIAGQTLA